MRAWWSARSASPPGRSSSSQYFTDPERLVRWLGPATLDASPGGELRVAVAGLHEVSGAFLEVGPPRRLVYAWGWVQPEHGIPPGGSRIEIDLTPVGHGTVLRQRHHGLGSDDAKAHGEGWMHYLRRLAVAAAGGDPGPDPLAAGAEAQGAPIQA